MFSVWSWMMADKIVCLLMATAAVCLLLLQMNPSSWLIAQFLRPQVTFRLLSKLSAALLCQTDSITAALLLWQGSVSVGSCSLGLWRRWLLLMFSCHRLAFHGAVSQRPEASHEESLEREINTNAVRSHLVSVTAPEIKPVHVTGWRVGDGDISVKAESEVNTWHRPVSTNSVNLPANTEEV